MRKQAVIDETDAHGGAGGSHILATGVSAQLRDLCACRALRGMPGPTP
jgi:hypothetical protein